MDLVLGVVVAALVCLILWEIVTSYRTQGASYGGALRLRLRPQAGRGWPDVAARAIVVASVCVAVELWVQVCVSVDIEAFHSIGIFGGLVLLGGVTILTLVQHPGGEIRERGLIYWSRQGAGRKSFPVFIPWATIRSYRWITPPGILVIELDGATRFVPLAASQVAEATRCLAEYVDLRQDAAKSSGVGSTPGDAAEVSLVGGEMRLRRFQFRLRAMFLLLLTVATAISWLRLTLGGGLYELQASGRLRALGPRVEFQHSRIVGLDFSRCKNPPGDADLEPLRHLRKLRRLNLAGTPITDATLAYLQDLPDLSDLDLSETQITDAGLAYLARKCFLRLTLDSTGVTDRGLAHLKTVPHFMRLSLFDTKVTEEGLREFRKAQRFVAITLQKPSGNVFADQAKQASEIRRDTEVMARQANALERLKALGAEVEDSGRVTVRCNREKKLSDQDLEPLRDVALLESLWLHDTPVTDATLAYLKDLRLLDCVDLSRTKVTDAGLQYLMKSKSLKLLWLDGTSITDDGLRRLAGLKCLMHLSLNDTRITDAGVEHLVNLRLLDSLNLQRTALTDAGLARLANLPSLMTLDLTATAITDAGLPRLSPLQSLEYLRLGQTRVTGAGLTHVAQLKQLRSLNLDGVPITAKTLKALKELPRLKLLHLSDTAVDDASLAYVAEVESLESLVLDGTRITDAGLVHLRKLKHLNRLFVDKTAVTEAGVQELHKALPKAAIRWGDNKLLRP